MKKFIAFNPSNWDQSYKENLLRVGTEYTIFVKMYELHPDLGKSRTAPRVCRYTDALLDIQEFAKENGFNVFIETVPESRLSMAHSGVILEGGAAALARKGRPFPYYKTNKYGTNINEEIDEELPECERIQRERIRRASAEYHQTNTANN